MFIGRGAHELDRTHLEGKIKSIASMVVVIVVGIRALPTAGFLGSLQDIRIR
jgi:hypothetical protein